MKTASASSRRPFACSPCTQARFATGGEQLRRGVRALYLDEWVCLGEREDSSTHDVARFRARDVCQRDRQSARPCCPPCGLRVAVIIRRVGRRMWFLRRRSGPVRGRVPDQRLCGRRANDMRARLELHLVGGHRLAKPDNGVIGIPCGAAHEPEQPLLRPADECVAEDVEGRKLRKARVAGERRCELVEFDRRLVVMMLPCS